MAKIIFGKIFYYKWLLKVYWLWISSNIDFDFCRIVLLFAGYCNYGIGLYHRHVWPAMGTVSSNIGNNFFVSCPCGHKHWCCPKVCTELFTKKKLSSWISLLSDWRCLRTHILFVGDTVVELFIKSETSCPCNNDFWWIIEFKMAWKSLASLWISLCTGKSIVWI